MLDNRKLKLKEAKVKRKLSGESTRHKDKNSQVYDWKTMDNTTGFKDVIRCFQQLICLRWKFTNHGMING